MIGQRNNEANRASVNCQDVTPSLSGEIYFTIPEGYLITGQITFTEQGNIVAAPLTPLQTKHIVYLGYNADCFLGSNVGK
jgi:hypothetical protein